MTRYSRITGTGSYLPPRRLTNDDLVAELAQRGIETSDEWIVERTGIRARHFAAPDVACSDLALEASRQALTAAGRAPQDIDLIIVATSTPDMVFPSAACILQNKLGANGCPAFDVQAVCSGFMYALTVADAMIRAGTASRALVVGSEVFSRILDFNDRTTCVLFGDGAGAVVLQASDEGKGDKTDRGILTTHLHSEGAKRDLLYVDGGPSSTRSVGHVRMNGKEVFRNAVTRMSEAIVEAMEASGVSPSEVNWLVPHQANRRIIDATAEKLNLSPEKVVVTVQDHGNTSAASIPLALATAVEDGRIQRGDLILMEAMGGGLTWGAALARW